MTLRARFLAIAWVGSLCAGACGGKVAGQDGTVIGADGGHIVPPPSCGDICAHIVGSCVPGASTDGCVSDCEAGANRFAATPCEGLLDTYLRCMITTRVECHGTDVVVIDCSDERNALDMCHP
jgi:hypothetical protein